MFLIILLVIEEEVLVVMFIHIRLIHFIDLFLIIKDFLAWPHVQMGLMSIASMISFLGCCHQIGVRDL